MRVERSIGEVGFIGIMRRHPEIGDELMKKVSELTGVEVDRLKDQKRGFSSRDIGFTLSMPSTGNSEGLSPHGGGWNRPKKVGVVRRKIKPPVTDY